MSHAGAERRGSADLLSEGLFVARSVSTHHTARPRGSGPSCFSSLCARSPDSAPCFAKAKPLCFAAAVRGMSGSFKCHRKRALISSDGIAWRALRRSPKHAVIIASLTSQPPTIGITRTDQDVSLAIFERTAEHGGRDDRRHRGASVAAPQAPRLVMPWRPVPFPVPVVQGEVGRGRSRADADRDRRQPLVDVTTRFRIGGLAGEGEDREGRCNKRYFPVHSCLPVTCYAGTRPGFVGRFPDQVERDRRRARIIHRPLAAHDGGRRVQRRCRTTSKPPPAALPSRQPNPLIQNNLLRLRWVYLPIVYHAHSHSVRRVFRVIRRRFGRADRRTQGSLR